MVERHEKGESLTAIARDMELNYYTVRGWWRRYRDVGWAGLEPRPTGRPRGALQTFDPRVKYVLLRLKRAHPGWGPDTLRLGLQRRASLASHRLPHRTALYTYLRRFHPRLSEHRRLRTQSPTAKRDQVEAVHQRWQMDSKGAEAIADVGKIVAWVVCDEYTSAPLAGVVQREYPALTTRQVQTYLRQTFAAWGLPDQLKMDRASVFVGSSRLEWPGVLLLWLVGLGVDPVVNRPHRPTDNAQVERCNRTWNEQVALGLRAAPVAAIQAATDQAWQDRRECLPSRNPQCQGQPPLLAHPELQTPRRAYSFDDEAGLFDMQRVYHYLSQWSWQRKVDPQGCISMADHNRLVGRDYCGQIVKVHFDPLAQVFVAAAVDGTELRHFTLPVISPNYLMGDGV